LLIAEHDRVLPPIILAIGAGPPDHFGPAHVPVCGREAFQQLRPMSRPATSRWCRSRSRTRWPTTQPLKGSWESHS